MSDFSTSFGRGGLNDQVDADRLVEAIGLDREEIEWRKEFVNFDDDDVRRLQRLEDPFEKRADQIAEMFYDNLTPYEQTRDVVARSPKDVEQLKQTQKAYLRTLAGGEYGESYFETRARIGKLHDLLDMPIKHYIGQYGVYYELLLPLIVDRIQDGVSTAIRDAIEEPSPDGGTRTQEGRTDDTPNIDAEVDETDDGSPDELTLTVDVSSLENRVDEEIEAGLAEFHSVLKIINLDMQVAVDTYLDSYVREIRSSYERQQSVAGEVTNAIHELNDAAADVATSAEHISNLARDQSDRMDSVSEEVSDLSTTVEEIAATGESVADNSQTAYKYAERGRERGKEVLSVMEDVDEASESAQEDVRQLQRLVDEIDEVIGTIDDIADQTNLLALNASIEAAHADESGAGFAVVANEVKSLAEETQDEASEIETLLENVKQAAEATAQSLETTNERVDEGVSEVEDTMELLVDISSAVEDTADGIEEVARATDEQASSTEEIAAAIDEVTERANEMVHEVDEVAAATEQQAEMTDNVESAVTRLEADDDSYD